MPDGTPFSLPDNSPLPGAIEVPENAAGQIVWLSLPLAAANTREVEDTLNGSASRYLPATEMLIDSTAGIETRNGFLADRREPERTQQEVTLQSIAPLA